MIPRQYSPEQMAKIMAPVENKFQLNIDNPYQSPVKTIEPKTDAARTRNNESPLLKAGDMQMKINS